MSVVLSTGYAARSMLGGESFVDLFRDGVIELRGGPQPQSADAAVSNATTPLLGRITRDGLNWTPGAPTGGLRWFAADRFVIKEPSHRWVIKATGTGTVTWMRLLPNAGDDNLASQTAPRIIGGVGLIDSEDDAQLWLPTVLFTPTTEIEVQHFWFAIPPIPTGD